MGAASDPCKRWRRRCRFESGPGELRRMSMKATFMTEKEVGSFMASMINTRFNAWHGGSIGGEEDKDKFDFDLCESCAEELSNLIDIWLKNSI